LILDTMVKGNVPMNSKISNLTVVTGLMHPIRSD
jgi:hypothetical protein